MKVCAHRTSSESCPELTNDTYCELHYKAKRQASDSRRPSSGQRGYDTEWRRTRRRYLSLHPICEYEAGCIAPATDVHHLDGRGPNGVNGHDDWNLQSLCHPHHSQITATEQKGGWNA